MKQMNKKEDNLPNISQTMLQTIYARAKETKKKKPLIYDKKAVEITAKLNNDFSLADKDFLMSSGVIARTILLDELVRDFLVTNPKAMIINIACGLDTRSSRLDNGKMSWYDLDLPEVINIRKRYFIENERIKMLAASATEEAWVKQVNKKNEPVLIIIEGLSMYLQEVEVKKMLTIIAANFAGATIYMEIMAPMVVKHVEEKSIKATNSKFVWGVSSGRDILSLVPNISFIKDYSLMEVMPRISAVYKIIGKIPFIRNLANKITVLKVPE